MNTKIVVPKEFDVSIYPISSLVTTDGVQYDTVVTNQAITYKNLFDIDSDTCLSLLRNYRASFCFTKIIFILHNFFSPFFSRCLQKSIEYFLRDKHKRRQGYVQWHHFL